MDMESAPEKPADSAGRNEKELQEQVQKRVHSRLAPLFSRYGMNPADLEAVLKWKPIVLIIGNYSSGKSTLINEILGQDLQRTGQAPTDDSFTIITAAGPGRQPATIPGATLVNDERLPFSSFKTYGEQLIAHLRMKTVDLPALENLAIIDTPGMLDSVAEKDRGYNYMGVLGDFAKLADLIVLMFDPHKAGTIKETYTAIRNTLPETSGEDRIVFAMSRIDECDNLADLVRSYGTLCWNLSQMTGRKDIPRIFLTYSPAVARHTNGLEAWADERRHLIERIMAAPSFRISHILQDVDKRVNELKMTAEAMVSFGIGGRRLLRKTAKIALLAGVFLFFFLDVIIRELSGFPEQTFLSSLLAGRIDPANLAIPTVGLLGVLLLASLWLTKWQLPHYRRTSQQEIDRLIALDSAHREHAWARVRPHVIALINSAGAKNLWLAHHRNLYRIRKFIREDLREFYSKLG